MISTRGSSGTSFKVVSYKDIFSLIQMDAGDGIMMGAAPPPPEPRHPEATTDASNDEDAAVVGALERPPPEHHDFKIVAELRPQDAYFLQKTRGATIVPTYAVKGHKERVIGPPLTTESASSQGFVHELASSKVAGVFPKGAYNRALEVIY